jgi:hypothetical protein
MTDQRLVRKARRGVVIGFGVLVTLFVSVLGVIRWAYGPAPVPLTPPADVLRGMSVLAYPKDECAVRDSDGRVIGTVLSIVGKDRVPAYLWVQAVMVPKGRGVPGRPFPQLVSVLGITVEPCAGRYYSR